MVKRRSDRKPHAPCILLKVMRINNRLGDSYGSLAPGLRGRKASRDVSAQDLHAISRRSATLDT